MEPKKPSAVSSDGNEITGKGKALPHKTKQAFWLKSHSPPIFRYNMSYETIGKLFLLLSNGSGGYYFGTLRGFPTSVSGWLLGSDNSGVCCDESGAVEF